MRISPPNSRNTCGFFSPDGRVLIFASTAGKEDPTEPAGGLPAAGGQLPVGFPERHGDLPRRRLAGRALTAAQRRPQVDLAKPEHPITNNDAYDAEGAFSPGRQVDRVSAPAATATQSST